MLAAVPVIVDKNMSHRQPIFIAQEPVILASGSPRRRFFLEQLGIEFTIRVAAVDETAQDDEEPEGFVLRLAGEKAAEIATESPASWVLAADTVVVLDHHILGKPSDAAEALSMLQRLAGRWHEVWTGFCMCRHDPQAMIKHAVRTEVCFAALSDEVLKAYVATGEPLDKAGAYGIQGHGAFLVEQIRGSYSNVVGLPLAEVVAEMLRLEIITPGLT